MNVAARSLLCFGLLSSLACRTQAPVAPPAVPDPFTDTLLQSLAPPPAEAEEIRQAFRLSQDLSCSTLLAVDPRQVDAWYTGGCPVDPVTLTEAVVEACGDTPAPPGLAPDPELAELDAVNHLRDFGHLWALEVIDAPPPPPDALPRAALLVMFQAVRNNLWDDEPALALACAELGLAESAGIGRQHERAGFTEAMAFVRSRMRDAEASKLWFTDAAAQYEALPHPYYLRRLEANYATIHHRRENRPAEARAGLARGLGAYIAIEDVDRTLSGLTKLAMAAFYDYDLPEAERLARGAVELARRWERPEAEGDALIALGHTLSERGDAWEATATYRRALERFDTFGPRRLNWLNAFTSLIDLELSTLGATTDPVEARARLEALDKTVQRASDHLAELSPEQWVQLQLNHARIKLELGLPDAAEALTGRVADRITTDHLTLWATPAALLRGDTQLALGRLDLADAAYAEALRLSRASGDLTLQWTALLGQSSVAQRRGDRGRALQLIAEAAAVVEALWVEVREADRRGLTPGGEAATFLESQVDLYDRAVETLLEGQPTPADISQAWWWLERRRSNELRARLGANHAEATLPSLDQAAAWLPLIQRHLAADVAGSRGVVLEYHLSRNAGYVFIVTPTDLAVERLPGGAAAVDATLYRAFPFLKDGAARDLPVDAAGLTALSAQILAPALPHLRPGDHVRIVPDGRLTLVPFEMLEAGGAGQPLLTQHTVAYESSASRLREPPPAPLDGEARLLSVAVGQALPAAAGGAGLPALPCALAESARVVRQGDLALVDDAATEESFRALAPGYTLLHLATHGVVTDGDYRRSHLALQPGATSDGELSLAEIASLRLDARLAIIPACRSGSARMFRGEGLQGVGTAFRRAGVPSTIVGLWELPDVAGLAELVGRVVDYTRAGLALSDALGRAKLDLRAAGAPPRLWAPLVLYGETAPLYTQVRLPEGGLGPVPAEVNAPCGPRTPIGRAEERFEGWWQGAPFTTTDR